MTYREKIHRKAVIKRERENRGKKETVCVCVQRFYFKAKVKPPFIMCSGHASVKEKSVPVC